METYIVITSVLLLMSILASKVSDRFGIPSLLVFLMLGMLAGSEGVGGIYFDDHTLAQSVGVVALCLILFSSGLSTLWQSVRPVFVWGFVLSTFGVVATALVVALFAERVLGFTLKEGLLLGSIVSSTDAPAVFSILRSKGISLKSPLKPLLELESGSNDPMAVLLTIGAIQLITQPDSSLMKGVKLFFLQISLGAAGGCVMGKAIPFLVNRIKLGYEGLYTVLTLALALFTYSFTNMLGGNGFLAVYLAGIIAGNSSLIHKRSLLHFHDGLSWLMQITMFITLGLLVFPSHLPPVMGVSLLAAACLMFVARPIAVFLSLIPSPFTIREKLFLSWVGLRGSAPIILATFPLLAGIPQSDMIFNVVFFVVLASVLFQGTSIQTVAKWLGVDAPLQEERVHPIEINPDSGYKGELSEFSIPENSKMAGKKLVDLRLPAKCLIVLITRGNEYILPSGATSLYAGDTLLVLADKDASAQLASDLNESQVFEAEQRDVSMGN